MTIEAAPSGTMFPAFLTRCCCFDQVLLPELRRTKPDAVIVLDNLSAHKTRAVRALLDRSGFAYRRLPPYSPELNPIGLAWAKIKARLRMAAARSAAALPRAIPAPGARAGRGAPSASRHGCGGRRKPPSA